MIMKFIFTRMQSKQTDIVCCTRLASFLTLARIQCFATFASGEGGGGAGATRWRFQTKRRRVSRKNQQDALAEYLLAIGRLCFARRSIFDLFITGQRTVFAKKSNFFN